MHVDTEEHIWHKHGLSGVLRMERMGNGPIAQRLDCEIIAIRNRQAFNAWKIAYFGAADIDDATLRETLMHDIDNADFV